jgi:hypothetical protein
MIFDGEFADPWGPDEPRESRFCFIGRNLDRQQARILNLRKLLEFGTRSWHCLCLCPTPSIWLQRGNFSVKLKQCRKKEVPNDCELEYLIFKVSACAVYIRVCACLRGQITEEFMACVVKDSDRLRFAVGDRVRCQIGDSLRQRWATGKVLRVSGDLG